MNPDECRKAFEVLAVEQSLSLELMETDEYLSRKTQEAYEWFLVGQSSRTESKPVTREEIDELAGQMEDCISFDESGNFCGFNHKQAENILFKVLHLPAPQSPVVPGVEELSRVFMKGARSNWTKLDNPHDADDQPLSIDDGVKAIHTHLLATGGRESREDDNPKKELDELQRKAFNEYVGMANRYRQALDRIYRMVCDVVANPADNDMETFVAIMTDIEALATTSPNDGSGRG